MMTMNEMNFKAPYLLFLGDENLPLAIKMSRGLAQWRPELCIGEFSAPSSDLTLGLKKLSIDEAAAAGAKMFILGLANSGGRISESWLPYIIEALENGLDVASGLHQKLSDIPHIKAAAEKFDRQLFDVRHFDGQLITGKGHKRSGKRILTVGTDCSVGKMYASLAIEKEMKARGYDVNFRATGQTGLMIAGSGICIDAIVSDFISGAVEQISPANDEDHWDIIEGQGSLYNPSFAGVSTGLLHGAQPDLIVMCHEAGRQTIKDLPNYKIPDLSQCIQANLQVAGLTSPNVKLAGIALNCRTIGKAAGLAEMARLEQKFSVPCFDPIITGASSLVDSL